jgi:Kelch motif protein
VVVAATVGVTLALVVASGLREPRPTAPLASGVTAWRMEPKAPVALTEVAAAAHDGRIWVAGGLTADGRASDRVLVFEPATGQWTDGPRLREPVHHAALVSDGQALVLIAGYLGDTFDRPTAHAWRLDSATSSWVPWPPLPAPRAAGAAASYGPGRIMYGGGVGPDGVSSAVFASGAGRWTQLGRLRVAREHLAATSPGTGNVTFLGGRRGDVGNLGTVDLVSAEGIVGAAEDLPTPRGGVAAFSWPMLGDCLVGGEGPNGTFGEVECAGTIRIVTLPKLNVARHGLGAAVVEGRAYVLLGGEQPGLFVSDVVESLELP